MLSHEEVVNQLDNETVSYAVGLGVLNSFTDIFRVSIKVEIAHYETAIAWLKDLVYGAEFDKDRYIYNKIFSSLWLTYCTTGCKSFWPRYSNLFHNWKEAGLKCLGRYVIACYMMIAVPLGLEGFFLKPNLFPDFRNHYRNRLVKSLQILKKSESIVRCSPSLPTMFKTGTFTTVTDPSGIRFSVTGNILNLPNPRSTWGKYFTSALPVRYPWS